MLAGGPRWEPRKGQLGRTVMQQQAAPQQERAPQLPGEPGLGVLLDPVPTAVQ